MKISKLALSRRPAFLMVMTLASCAALAQGYPSRPIKLIVPFPAGGGTDIIAREVAQQGRHAATAGPSSSTTSRAPAATSASMRRPSRPPDGYTLVLGQTSNLAINPTLYAKLPYDPVKDLTPIGAGRECAAGPRRGRRLAVQDAGRRGRGRRRPSRASLNYATRRQRHGRPPGGRAVPEDRRRQVHARALQGRRAGARPTSSAARSRSTCRRCPTLIGHIKQRQDARPRGHVATSASPTCRDVPTDRASRATRASRPSPGSASLGPAGMPKDVVAKLNADSTRRCSSPSSRRSSTTRAPTCWAARPSSSPS